MRDPRGIGELDCFQQEEERGGYSRTACTKAHRQGEYRPSGSHTAGAQGAYGGEMGDEGREKGAPDWKSLCATPRGLDYPTCDGKPLNRKMSKQKQKPVKTRLWFIIFFYTLSSFYSSCVLIDKKSLGTKILTVNI